jgi:ribonuclease HI
MSGNEIDLLREVYRHLKAAGFHQRTPEQKARLEALFKKLAGLLKERANEPTLGGKASEGQPAPSAPATPHSGSSRALESAPTLVLNVDGASRGNPGPAGAGGVLSTPEGEALETFAVPLGRRTNNEAEYLALIQGLSICARYKPSRLTVRSDSLLLVKQMRGEFRVKKSELVKLALEARRRFPCREVRFEHVPRERNAEADHLANLGVESSLDS